MSKKRFGEIAGGIFLILVGFAFGIIMVYQPVFTRDTGAYCNLSVTLAKPPEISSTSRRPDDWVFSFKEYPDISFGVHKYYCQGKEIDGLNIGDTANITVLKEEYRRRIGHKGNIFERLVSKRPDLYGFIKDGKNYINFEKIAADHLSPVIVYPILIFFMIGFLCSGIRIVFLKRPASTAPSL
jgi:hypothetical protein